MRQGDGSREIEKARSRVGQDAVPKGCVPLHQAALGLAEGTRFEQDLVRHAELSDVVQAAGARDYRRLPVRQTERPCSNTRVLANLLEMAPGPGVDELGGPEERPECLFAGWTREALAKRTRFLLAVTRTTASPSRWSPVSSVRAAAV